MRIWTKVGPLFSLHVHPLCVFDETNTGECNERLERRETHRQPLNPALDAVECHLRPKFSLQLNVERLKNGIEYTNGIQIMEAMTCLKKSFRKLLL